MIDWFSYIFFATANFFLPCGYADDLVTRSFPDDFLLGAATAAYSVEGAWNEDAKGANIWDNLTHLQPELIADKANGDVACDSYHKITEDVALLENLNADHYSFSLSWSRILPKGYSYNINPGGVEYYNKLINALLAKGIIPIVTLYHWDLPQVIQDMGGWANELISDYFEDYARIVFENFGDRVKHWITFNDPHSICFKGYGEANLAPALNSSGLGDYLCTYTILKSHARVYRLYNATYKTQQHGKIGISLGTPWMQPYNSSSREDAEAAQVMMDFVFGTSAEPIFGNGDYPEAVKRAVAVKSRNDGFAESLLITLSENDKKFIKSTYDFLGLNYYETQYAAADSYGCCAFSWIPDTQTYILKNSRSGSSAAVPKVAASGLRKLLNWIKRSYGNVEIFITENGYPDSGQLDDISRAEYLQQCMSVVIDAIYEDHINVKGFTIWSLMDGFQWLQGYTVKYGLYSVNFNDPARTRSPKTSARIIRKVFAERKLAQTSQAGLSKSAVFNSVLFYICICYLITIG